MKEITVLSGKGGAGKTTFAAALASVAQNAVFCDNDVDAADLHLIFQPEIKESHSFSSGNKAEIQSESCTNCGLCAEKCRFDAIHFNTKKQYKINPFQCEGCRLCERICPENAIQVFENTNNSWYVSNTRFGKLVHAKMGPGEENSGKLVTRIREKAKEIALDINADFIINDGPPGIGCSAISSVTGTDLVLMVIEPTLSGLHDAKRLMELVRNFEIPVFAVINKYDLNPKVSENVIQYLSENHIRLAGKINFDKNVVKSIIFEKTIVEFSPKCNFSKEIYYIWNQITEHFSV
ncbi:(4Fe-4S)-binding protein [Maribellus comscasis]|uniref:(4Fe-4S)-binding protein n=1 Tax=Maribellus comscasis TaxID=2681766 RepID=A0A6I6JW98_9BACT|nr:ATP-binding protein [Maribellus comscasis]QGY46891.1 (4Fe-4S)-binding protein [Maribellus comscasis]